MSRLVYTPEGDGFRLNYVIDLALSAPDGAWNVRVDAATGAVVSVEDTRLIRKITEETLTAEERLAAVSGPAWDRVAMFDRFAAQKSANDDIIAAGTLALGTGVVFDPDPRTTLNNNSLADNSAASAFTAAYFTRSLQDITLSGGLYRVTGPYVNIINFEAPTTAPSTTVDGNWTAVRGNNAFNDAMTYFHLDQNQRYMQSLGFTGPTGIQEGPIQTDTDGLSGADNSYFLPASNRLAFGHGCVDDNEDADVILHEYGHAIQHDITANWTGGDTGAMGEGFGDYWAASYSYVQPNGNTFFPDWIYTWDGHGASDACWPGRVLNATGAQYVPTTTYSAHASIPGGYQSDELWSTPLFQSLRTLMSQGYTRESVDQIILESHFGIGSGLKMRDMANLTIAAASALQPGGNHADVFIEKFLVHNIIQIPAASLSIASVTVSNAGANGVADPGETGARDAWNSRTWAPSGATTLSASLGTSTALVHDPAGRLGLPGPDARRDGHEPGGLRSGRRLGLRLRQSHCPAAGRHLRRRDQPLDDAQFLDGYGRAQRRGRFGGAGPGHSRQYSRRCHQHAEHRRQRRHGDQQLQRRSQHHAHLERRPAGHAAVARRHVGHPAQLDRLQRRQHRRQLPPDADAGPEPRHPGRSAP
ncbi:MAG: hypothetical protein V9F00_13950 [Nocardioides sp.]